MVLTKNFSQIPNEVFQAKTLSLKAIGLYSYLRFKSYCGNAQMAFPSQRKIMKDLNIGSDNTLRSVIRELENNGFLNVKRGSIYTGNSRYKLLIPKIYDHDNIGSAAI